MPAQFLKIAGSIAVADKISDVLLKKRGVSLRIYYEPTKEETEFYAFIQPLRYKNKLYLSHEPTELGFDTLQKYLMVTSPDVPLETVDGFMYRIYMGDTYLKVDHCEKVYFGKKPYYYWSIVSKEAYHDIRISD